ncbi:MAG TPA: CdaR family protein [Caldisericia bacterium]|nr:CdaR family protein [Caldisericia bacterium]HPB33839.1 CdaR family protein [Caldisericia bacterium]HQL66965.1 CdaR family protein [Caldisericia bacterium]HQN47928.1 CdaR family protein [Caldisericia bacterium]HQO99097.1 CdaR family protein [Caldisericia bacterium]
MIRKKLTIFFISLLLAFSFWLFVTIGEGPESERVFNVNVTYRNMGEGLTMLEPLDKVEIKIRGNKQRISTIKESSIVAYIDLKDLDTGIHNLEVEVEAPSFLKVVEIYPSRISVYLDKIVTVDKNIRVDFIGSLKTGLIIEEPEVSPNKISISGPSKKIETIRDVSITVDLTTINSDITLTSIPKIKDGLGNDISGLSFNPSIVTLNIKVKSILSSKVVPVIPNLTGEISGDYGIKKVSVSPSILTIFGKVDELKNIEYLQTEEIKIGNLTESKIFNTSVILPANIELKEENKISVQIIIEKKISKVVSDINISIKDINENFNYKIVPESLEVEIYGFISIVNEVKSSDFEAYVSVLDLTPGEHNLKINITSLKEDIKIVRIIPSEIKVIVTKKEE